MEKSIISLLEAFPFPIITFFHLLLSTEANGVPDLCNCSFIPATTEAMAIVAFAFCMYIADSIAAVDNRRWKKVIIGKGNASKSEIMDFSISQWGDQFPEQDYADAACIALWRRRDGR